MSNSKWELFTSGFVVNGVAGHLYLNVKNRNVWKWRGNVFVASTRREAGDWLRSHKIQPQRGNKDYFHA